MVDSGSLSAAMSLPGPGLLVVVEEGWGKPWLGKPFAMGISQYTINVACLCLCSFLQQFFVPGHKEQWLHLGL